MPSKKKANKKVPSKTSKAMPGASASQQPQPSRAQRAASKKQPAKAVAGKTAVSKAAVSKAAVSKAAVSKAAVSKAAVSKAAVSKATVGDTSPLAKGSPPAGSATAPQARAKALRPSPPSASDVGSVPAFELQDTDGQTHSADSLRGKPYVLYFYPKDDTPGCTKEACDFNDALSQFAASGARVIGVSPDSAASHGRFRGKYGLNFTLLSDPDTVLSRALGVYKLKSNYGRHYMGIERSTFLVDEKGQINRAWRGVRVAGHVAEVLEALRGLSTT